MDHTALKNATAHIISIRIIRIVEIDGLMITEPVTPDRELWLECVVDCYLDALRTKAHMIFSCTTDSAYGVGWGGVYNNFPVGKNLVAVNEIKNWPDTREMLDRALTEYSSHE